MADLGDGHAGSALRRRAHQLKGSGATFGFAEIAAAAGAVEEAADDRTLTECVRALLASIEAAVAGD